jgi:hypothetical protein
MVAAVRAQKDVGGNVAEQVDDLRERMRLLQGDRRANVDILEANKSANKEEIKRWCHVTDTRKLIDQ